MEQRSRTQNTIINTAAGFLTRFSNMIARFMLQSTLIYVLGIQYTGISNLFTSILTILSLAELGIGNAIAYELYSPLATKDIKRITALMNFYKMAYRIVAFMILALGIFIIPFLDFFVKDVPEIKENIIVIYLLFIIKTVMSYLLVYKSTLLIADQKNYIVSNIQSLTCFFRTIMECVILFITHQYISYLILEIIGNIIQNLWISYVVNEMHPELRTYNNIQLEKKEKYKLLHDIKGLAMYKTSYALGTGVDNIIISAFVGTSAVGLVSNYTLIRKELEQLNKQFYNAVISSVGNLSVTSTINKQLEVFSNLLFIDFWISCFCSVSYFMMVQPFISLWLGEKYLLSIGISAVLAIDFYLSCMLEPIASFRTANGIFIQGQYRPLIMAVINVVLSIVFGYVWGIVGVFIATITARLITQWYDPYLLYKLVFKRRPFKFYLYYYVYMFFSIVVSGIVFGLSFLFSYNNIWQELIIKAILCIIIPNSLIILFYKRTSEFNYFLLKTKKIYMTLQRKKWS